MNPYIQLLLVLPIQSHYLLPNILKNISEIIFLYPFIFNQDFLNKSKYWMAIPILPILDLRIIKDYYNKYNNHITNQLSIHTTYIYELN